MSEKIKKNQSVWNKIAIIAVAVVLIAYTLSVVIVLLWGFMTSLKSVLEFSFVRNVAELPTWKYSKDEILFGNYSLVLSKLNFPTYVSYYSGGELIIHQKTVGFWGMLGNTLLYSGVGALLTTIFPAVVAYMCAKYRYKSSKTIYWFVVITMAIPVIGVYPAELSLLRNLGLFDTFLGFALQKSYFMNMYFLVFFAFFESMSDAYMEAAEIDGASDFRVMVQIMMPLAGKILGSVLLLQFVTFWNDYQTARLYMPTHPTIAYGVWALGQGEQGIHTGDTRLSYVPARVTGCMLLAIPISIIYVAFRDKLMGNLSMGGVKG